jgi:hypothetical protein
MQLSVIEVFNMFIHYELFTYFYSTELIVSVPAAKCGALRIYFVTYSRF